MGKTHKRKSAAKQKKCKVCKKPLGDNSRHNVHKGCVSKQRGSLWV